MREDFQITCLYTLTWLTDPGPSAGDQSGSGPNPVDPGMAISAVTVLNLI